MKNFLFAFAFIAFLSPCVFAEDTTPQNNDAPTVTKADPFSITTKLEKVLYPSVRVLNGSGGGSGTVVYSEDREGTGEFQTFVVTNHHVIDSLIQVKKVWDNLTQSYKYIEDNKRADVELFAYADGGRTVTKTSVKADIIAYVEDEDIALLKLVHPFKIQFTAKILPPGKHLVLFQVVYAVGCPLLVDPMFTQGEITDLDNTIDQKSYTGGTANIIWGNSGGAVMSYFPELEDWYFCGIPSRGYGAPNGQFVTYLGYYVTPERIRNFATSQELKFLVDPTTTPTQAMEARRSMHRDAPSSAPSSDGGAYAPNGGTSDDASD